MLSMLKYVKYVRYVKLIKLYWLNLIFVFLEDINYCFFFSLFFLSSSINLFSSTTHFLITKVSQKEHHSCLHSFRLLGFLYFFIFYLILRVSVLLRGFECGWHCLHLQALHNLNLLSLFLL